MDIVADVDKDIKYNINDVVSNDSDCNIDGGMSNDSDSDEDGEVFRSKINYKPFTNLKMRSFREKSVHSSGKAFKKFANAFIFIPNSVHF